MGPRRYVRGVVPCTACGRATRARTVPIEKYPDTVVRYSRGLCWPCYSEGAAPTRLTARADEAATREAFEAFIRARRNRGIPPEGTQLREAS